MIINNLITFLCSEIPSLPPVFTFKISSIDLYRPTIAPYTILPISNLLAYVSDMMA
jgi:hypothetical protein